MKFKFARFVSLPFLFAIAANSYATPLCSYSAYSPESLRATFANRLAKAGVAAVPGSVGLLRDQAKDELFLAGEGLGFGFMKQTSNAAAGTNSVVILDSAHKEIARADEIIEACSGGLCRLTTFTISVAGKASSISVSQMPSSGVDFYIGKQYAPNPTMWRAALDDYLTHVMNQLFDNTRAVRLAPLTRVQRLTVALATDVTIAPYLPLLRVELNRARDLVLRGRTNFSIYQLIMQRALDTGLIVKPEVILDSSIRFDVQPSVDLQRCI
jgi:hypothetical protein